MQNQKYKPKKHYILGKNIFKHNAHLITFSEHFKNTVPNLRAVCLSNVHHIRSYASL